MKLADLRVVRADIPVRRPHKMSFTTLEAVNFVFVRLETSDGLVGWGEAACLGGPTWSEESTESVAATIERYVAPWLVGRDPTAIEAAHARIALGHRIFKVKTGAGALADDVERVRRLREAVGPAISLRVDANQGWDRPTARRAVRALEPYGLDFVEQPVPRWDLEGLAMIAERAPMPIM